MLLPLILENMGTKHRISYERLRAMFPNGSRSFLEANLPPVAAGPHPAIAEQDQGSALERSGEGEEASCGVHQARFKIVFRVRSCQPCDWDNYRCKELQDLLVKIGVLPDDKWSILRGEVIPEKVEHRAEEGTVIEVYEWMDAPG